MPFMPYVIGSSVATVLVLRELSTASEGIMLSPTGPLVASDPSNAYAVRFLIEQFWPDAEFDSEAPDLTEIFESEPNRIY